ncbi:MAG: non-heme iron oxygenase ferredoxin subunit [bacterium]
MLVKVLNEGELKNSEMKDIIVKGAKFTLYRVKDEYYGTDRLCTHKDGPLAEGYLENDYEVVCPWHGAKFDIRTGKCTGLPANNDIGTYKIVKKDNEIFVEITEITKHACKKNCEHCKCEDNKKS